MSLRLLASKRGNDTKVFDDWGSVFDPRLNEVWFKDSSFVPVATWWLFTLALYTKENVRNNLKEFFPFWFGHGDDVRSNEYIDYILSLFTDENIWYLYYCAFERVGQDRITAITYRYLNEAGTEELMYLGLRDNYNTHDDPITSVSNRQYFSEVINKQSKILRTKIEGHIAANRKYYKSNLGPQTSGYQIKYLYHMFLGQRYCATTVGQYAGQGTLSVGTIMEALREFPNAKVIWNAANGGHNPHPKVILRVTQNERSALYKVLQYSTNVLDLMDWPITNKGEYDPILYGVELELSSDYEVRTLIDAGEVPFFAIKSDGSVNGSKRFMYECVTVPMSFKAHKRQWAKWFNNLNYDQFDTTTRTNNGMHVHVAKAQFHGKSHIRNFCWFINNPANREFIFQLSERDRASFDKYSKNFDIPYGYNKGRSLKEAAELAATVRGATNIHKKGQTVEVRLFKGIVSFASILKNLEAVDAIFSYTSNVNLQDMNLKKFFAWLWSTPRNRYGVFKKFVQTLNIDELSASSEILDCIFMEQDAVAIVKQIERKKFPVTNAHVTYLNKLRKKRTFVLNKDTNQVEVVIRDRPKLSSYDDVLQARYGA